MSSTTPSDLAPVPPGLWDPHRTARLGPYIGDVWKRRSYMRFVASSELRARQVDTVLGNLWHLLNPALSIATYYLVFGLLLGIDRGVDNFILFLAVGVFVFGFTQRTTVSGATSITGNVGLVKAIRFPRAVLPVTSSITEAFTAIPTFAVMFAVAFLTGQTPRWQWVVVPVVFVVQFLFNTGAALVAARLTVHLRDTTQVLPLLFRLLFFGSGVIFSVEAYATGANKWFFILNPMYCFVSLMRWCVLDEVIPLSVIISTGVWTIALLVIGFLWFKAGEEIYARD